MNGSAQTASILPGKLTTGWFCLGLETPFHITPDATAGVGRFRAGQFPCVHNRVPGSRGFIECEVYLTLSEACDVRGLAGSPRILAP